MLTRQGKPASQNLAFVPLALPARPQTRDRDLRSLLPVVPLAFILQPFPYSRFPRHAESYQISRLAHFLLHSRLVVWALRSNCPNQSARPESARGGSRAARHSKITAPLATPARRSHPCRYCRYCSTA